MNTNLRNTIFLVLLTCAVAADSRAQALRKGGFLLGGSPSGSPASNSINDIFIDDHGVWIATSRGLSRTKDGVTWNIFSGSHGIGKGGISAVASGYGMMWVATAFDTTTDVGDFEAGGGLSVSFDGGETWDWLPQPVDDKDETAYKPTTTPIQNITYDITITEKDVWIASFGGGLRASPDSGRTWRVVTVDGFPFDALGRLEHRVFSVLYDGEDLWVGSAGGVHKSTDHGESWVTFSHQNQPEGISGNFVVALALQRTGAGKILWAATVEALDSDEFRAVSKTSDGGLTWEILLEGEFAHNFGIDPVSGAVYVATDNSVFKSLDSGETWAFFPLIVDSESGEKVLTTEITSVKPENGIRLWIGTIDGLAMTPDEGITWKIYRVFQIPGAGGVPDTYAYPNPFSPLRHNVAGGDGHVRFQYTARNNEQVTVRVYDFALNLVKTVVEGKERQPGSYSEAWDGRNETGDSVANGVYFYKVSFSSGDSAWGKVMVVN